MSQPEGSPFRAQLALNYLEIGISIATTAPVESFHMTGLGAGIMTLTEDWMRVFSGAELIDGNRVPYLHRHYRAATAAEEAQPHKISDGTLRSLSEMVARCNFPLNKVSAVATRNGDERQTNLAIVGACNPLNHHQITDYMQAFKVRPTVISPQTGPIFDILLPDGNNLNVRPWPVQEKRF